MGGLGSTYGSTPLACAAALYDNVIRVLVPLVAEEAQIEEGMQILEDAIRSVSS